MTDAREQALNEARAVAKDALAWLATAVEDVQVNILDAVDEAQAIFIKASDAVVELLDGAVDAVQTGGSPVSEPTREEKIKYIVNTPYARYTTYANPEFVETLGNHAIDTLYKSYRQRDAAGGSASGSIWN